MSSSMLCQNLQGCSGDQFVDQLFRVFDRDGDGGIDFKVWILKTKFYFFYQEFIIATDMCSSSNAEEKLRSKVEDSDFLADSSDDLHSFDFDANRWAFRMYDQDNSGAITPNEMIEIFSLMYAVQVAGF